MANTINATALTPIVAGAITSDYQVTIYDQAGNAGRAAVADVVSAANTMNNCVCIKTASVIITSAQVLQLNTTPIEIVPAVTGVIHEVLSASVEIIYNSIAYTTNTNLIIMNQGSGKMFEGDVLGFVASSISNMTPFLAQMYENVPVLVSVETNDPAAGNSDILVRVTYRDFTP
jgi:hypothetical protein